MNIYVYIYTYFLFIHIIIIYIYIYIYYVCIYIYILGFTISGWSGWGFTILGVPSWGPYYKRIPLCGGTILGVPYLRKPPYWLRFVSMFSRIWTASAQTKLDNSARLSTLTPSSKRETIAYVNLRGPWLDESRRPQASKRKISKTRRAGCKAA